MGANNRIRPLSGLFALLISLIICGPAFSYDNPDLLPANYTPVIDLAKILSNNQKVNLEQSLNDFEEDLGWSTGSGWQWSTVDYNSATHSMHSGDQAANASFDLVSPVIELPQLGDGEILALPSDVRKVEDVERVIKTSLDKLP